jgi:predicted MFS family arabinose efflux permease
MSIAFFACGFQLMFIGTHFPRYLAMCGLPPSVGAASLALIGGFNAVGSYMFGVLGTRYDKSKMLAGIYLVRTAAIVVYLWVPVSAGSTLVFASVMGFTWLGVSPLVSGLISGIFGLRHFNMLYGVVFLGHQVGALADGHAPGPADGGGVAPATPAGRSCTPASTRSPTRSRGRPP